LETWGTTWGDERTERVKKRPYAMSGKLQGIQLGKQVERGERSLKLQKEKLR